MFPLEVTKSLKRLRWQVTDDEWVSKVVLAATTEVSVGLTWNFFGGRSHIRIIAGMPHSFVVSPKLYELCVRVNADMFGPAWQLYPVSDTPNALMVTLERCVDVSPFSDEEAANYVEVLAADLADYYHETHSIFIMHARNPDSDVDQLLRFGLQDIEGSA
jgi:hypothetical protein